jgi:hypothetical protein
VATVDELRRAAHLDGASTSACSTSPCARAAGRATVERARRLDVTTVDELRRVAHLDGTRGQRLDVATAGLRGSPVLQGAGLPKPRPEKSRDPARPTVAAVLST